MAHPDKPDSNDSPITPDMARVIVHETFPYKLKNGSVQVLGPGPDYQIVKRDVADALVASGRGVLCERESADNE